MIKVYLDWNCITHCKDLWPEFKELLERYSNVFICPFGVAHLRDVQTKHEANPEAYEEDLDLLTEICGEHMLAFSGDDKVLYNVAPRDYLAGDTGKLLDILQNNFPFPYHEMSKMFSHAFTPEDFETISKEENPRKVIQLANDTIKRRLGFEGIEAFINSVNFLKNNTFEFQVKALYLVLDMLHYKTEDKGKSFSNIDTDAHHLYLASFCDYLISNDKKMRGKARVIFEYFHRATKIMDPYSFMKNMSNIATQCFDTDCIPTVIETYGFPRKQRDGMHFRALDYPLWGVFHFCYKGDVLNSMRPSNEAFFVSEQFMFYDELKSLAAIPAQFFPEQQRQSLIEQYVESYKQSKPKGINLKLNTPNYIFDFALTSFEGLPAMKVSYQQKKNKIS